MSFYSPPDIFPESRAARLPNCKTIFAESLAFEDCGGAIKINLFRHDSAGEEAEERVLIGTLVMARPNFYQALGDAIVQMLPVVPNFLRRLMH